MNSPLRVAMFLGSFPVVSETFILRQILGLLRAGQTVDLFSDARGPSDGPVHPEVIEQQLMERTVFMDAAPETIPYEMPVWPWDGETWPPGSPEAVPNWKRLQEALPAFLECLVEFPQLTWQAVRVDRYGYRAASLSALWRLHRLLPWRRRKYDVLHAHFGPVGESFRFARELLRAPLVVSFHGYDFTTLPRREGHDVYRRLFAAVDAVTVNSRYTQSRVEALGCPVDRLYCLPMGVDLNEIEFVPSRLPQGEPVRLLTVARLVPIKGHEFVLQSLVRLRQQGLALEYHVVGDGPLRGDLQAKAQALGLGDVVKFHGACDNAEVRQWLRRCHVFVLCSVTTDGDQEGQGLVLQEAQASGLPVVATRHGGLTEGLLPERSGFLVPEWDVAGLTDCLARLIQHPETWEAMGRAGRDYVASKYDQTVLTQNLLDLYRETAERFQRDVRVQGGGGSS